MKAPLLAAQAALALAILIGPLAAPSAHDDLPPLRHGYVDNRYGQLHFSIATPARRSDLPPLVLFHQSPNSSEEFHDLVRMLGRERIAIAIDTPGHGGSDGPATLPSIEDYAAAIAEGLRNLGYGPQKPLDVFGYHTGSKIVTELALAEPRMIRRVILSGLYDPPPEQLAQALANLHHPSSVSDLLERFHERLPQNRDYYARQGLSEEQWGRIRIDSLRGLTRQEFGHEAAFRYAPRFAARLALIQQPVLLLPLDDGLAQATRDAATRFKNVHVTPQTYAAGGFFTQTAAIADVMNQFCRDVLSLQGAQ
jgi:pimeloyl-ACP methyl ester carboxylesterase